MMECENFWTCLTNNVLSQDWFLPLVTILGGLFTLWRWRADKKYDRRNVELLNAPSFKFFDFCHECNGNQERLPLDSQCIKTRISPRSCKQCGDVHWFDLQYTGKVAIKNFSISLISEKDIVNLPIIIERRQDKRSHLAPDTVIQYKLPLEEIQKINSKHACFWVLIEYQSEYSNIRYKHIYHLCASIGDECSCEWPFNLVFYSSREETISQNHWYYFMRKIGACMRNTLCLRYSIEKNWIYDFWHKK